MARTRWPSSGLSRPDVLAAPDATSAEAGFAVRTAVGRVRADNEDRSLARPPVFAVADGMGGHRAGDVAADLAVGLLGEALEQGRVPDGPLLADAITRANAAIRVEARARPERLGMGTTCTVLAVGDTITIVHVGDSRAYRSRDGRLEQLTEDHSLVAALVRDGRLDPAAAPSDPRRHVITRALGADDDIRVDVVSVDRRPGDRFLLCSDGIHGQLDDATIERVLAESREPAAAAERLIDLADAAGGEDNATAVVIDADLVATEPAATKVGAGAPIADVTRRSRRRVAGRLVAAAIVVALIGAAAVWLAGGGLGPVVPVPSVATPSIPAPSMAVPSVSAPPPSIVATSPSPSPTSPVPSASASIPAPSLAAPGPS